MKLLKHYHKTYSKQQQHTENQHTENNKIKKKRTNPLLHFLTNKKGEERHSTP